MKQIGVVMLGVGGVGRALVEQIRRGRDIFAQRNQTEFKLLALVDSHGWVWQPEGLSDEQLTGLMALKQAGGQFAEAAPAKLALLHQVRAAGWQQVIVVDVTAAANMEPVLDELLALGYTAALANKKPFAGPWATAQPYFHNPRIRHEATVGAGQPVISTLRYLRDTGDPIYHLAGQLSGTLGFLCQQMEQGQSFAAALAEAKAKGYSEPDPRDDLSGRDVMRKLLILARMAGWPLEEADILVESLYPAEMGALAVEAFMAAAATLNEPFEQRMQVAAARGHTLRYIGDVTPQGGRVGLQEIPRHSPQANLKYISFQTEHYQETPLLVAGQGAGVGMTAAGVLGDMLSLAREIYGAVLLDNRAPV